MQTTEKELTPVIYNSAAAKVLHFYVDPNNGCFRSHWHERLELLRIKTGTLFVGNGNNTITAVAGDVVLIPPHAPHKGWAGDRWLEYDVLMFDVRTFYNETEVSKVWLTAFYENRLSARKISGCAPLLESIDTLCAETLAPMTAMAEIYRLLALLFEYCLQGLDLTTKQDSLAAEFVASLEERSGEDISVDELSRQFGYSKEHFCRKFKEYTGLSPMQYLKIFRVEQGYKMLKNGEKNIGKIAVLCGFDDANYFTRCFKSHFGFPPSQALRESEGGEAG